MLDDAMKLTTIDWIIIVAYFLIVFAVGLLFTKRAGKSMSDFFVSGRSLPWWIAGTSMVATTFAADTPLAVVALTAKHGMAGNWFWWAFALGGMFTVFVYAKLWRRAEVMTDVELIAIRYRGKPAESLRYLRAVYVALVVNPIIIGWVVGAMLTVLDQTVFYDPQQAPDELNLNSWLVILGMLAVVGIYCTLSGMWGVAITDVIQFCIAMVGCVWLAVVAVNHIGGIDLMRERVITNFGSDQAFAFFPNVFSDSAWMPLHIFLMMLGIQWWATWYPGSEPGGGGYVVQRMASAKDERHSVLATLWYQVAHYCVRPWPWLLVAFAALALYPELRSPETEDPGIGFPRIMRDLCPVGLRGLMMVTFFAAFMSTISTQMNWGASYLVRDFLQPNFGKDADEKTLTTFSRISSVVVLLLGIGVAFAMDVAGMSVDEAWKMLAALGAGTGAVFMLRWFWWRINAWSEIVAMGASLVYFILIEQISKQVSPERWDDTEKMTIVAGLTIATWLAATFLTKPEDEATLSSFYRKIRPGGPGWKPIAKTCPGVRPDGDLKLRLLGVLLGAALVYSTLPGIGYTIFGETTQAVVCFLIAGFSAIGLGFVVKRLFNDPNDVKVNRATDSIFD